MKGRFSAAFISSFGLHALFVLALIFTWQARPFKTEPPAVTVSIVTDAKSDALISTLETKADSTIDSGKPDGNNIPLPPPPAPPVAENIPQPMQVQAQPAPQPTKSQPAPSPAPSAAKQIAPQPAKPLAPTAPQKIVAQKQPAPTANNAASNAKPSPKPAAPTAAKPSNTTFGAEFDLSAAMKSASGVDAKGRKAPNLGTSASSVSSSGGKLANDLAAKIVAQMSRCWAQPEGGAAGVTVVIALKLQPNGAVKSSRLISPSGVGANAAQKIAIDNAQKAIRDCSPFDLPAARYNEWGNIDNFRFNTKQLK